jgi:hypothetical protein
MPNDSRSRQEKLIKRLRYLWTWELFDSFFLPLLAVVLFRMLDEPLGALTLYASGLVAWLLWQGSAYWYLKLQAIKTGERIKCEHFRWFARLKTINWVLIALLPAVLALKILRGDAAFGPDWTFGSFLYILAILEQINYYHRQLMYDYPTDWRYLMKHKRLKHSSLRRSLDRLRG